MGPGAAAAAKAQPVDEPFRVHIPASSQKFTAYTALRVEKLGDGDGG
jgi:hypothetical protein